MGLLIQSLSFAIIKFMRETIKKFNGMVVGYIEDKGDRLVATNFSGIVLGYYYKSRDVTTDFSGRVLAYGNILSALIWNQR